MDLKRGRWARRILWAPLAVRRTITRLMERSADTVLDRLAETAAGDIVLNVPSLGGAFAINPRSDIFRRLARRGVYEPDLVRCFHRYVRPDRDIVDAGANVGFFSVLGASLLDSGRVLAVEPVVHERLAANLERNGVQDRVIVYPGLLGAEAGESDINIVPGKEEYASAGPLAHTAVAGRSTVTERRPVETLDALVRRHDLRPALVKIDVEGAEALVIKGAAETIAAHRPVIVTEFSTSRMRTMSGHLGADLVAMIEAHGYVVSDFQGGRAGAAEYGYLLCVPNER